MYKSIVDRKIRIAIVGCGRIAKKHFSAVEKHHQSLKLIAVCDNSHSQSSYYAKKYNVPSFKSLTKMLEHDSIDVIVLCTPSGLHSKQTITAAHYRVNVITEKPMATRWKDALAMIKACDEASVRLFVVKQNRYNHTLKLLKQAIDEKRFGHIYLVHINVFWTRPQEYYDSAKWRGTWEFDGGAFMNQGSHYIDLLNWLVGPIKKVQAMLSTTRNIEVEDTGVLNIQWRNGSLGSMSVTMLTYPNNMEGSITILGENGSARIGGISANEIKHWTFKDSRDYDKHIQNASYHTSSVYGDGHSHYYKNFIEVMQGTSDPETDGREGLKSLEVLVATYLSARNGKTISLPLEY